jgi:hypothetical protein
MRWLSRRSPSTWPRKATRLVRVGAPFCAIICRTLLPWIYWWSRPSALSSSTYIGHCPAGSARACLDQRDSAPNGRMDRAASYRGRLSTWASSHHNLSLAGFITNIAESDFRYTQGRRFNAPAIYTIARPWILCVASAQVLPHKRTRPGRMMPRGSTDRRIHRRGACR